MSTTDTRAAFEAWMREEYGADDDMLKRPYEDRYFWPRAADAWAGWQAATEAAKAEKLNDDQPAMYCVPDKNGKPLFGKGWMFSPVPQMEATMPLYARPAAKATGTAQTKQSFENIEELPLPETNYNGYSDGSEPLYTTEMMRAYGQACAEAVLCAPDGESWQHKFEETDRALLYWKAKAKQTEAARQPAPVISLAHQIEESNYKSAFMEWSQKTDWVQEQISSFPPSALGMHRADVMREEIARLRAALAATAAPVLSDEQINRMAGRNGLYAAMTPDDRTCKSMVKRFVTEILDATRSQP